IEPHSGNYMKPDPARKPDAHPSSTIPEYPLPAAQAWHSGSHHFISGARMEAERGNHRLLGPVFAVTLGLLACLGIYQLWLFFGRHAPTLAMALAGGLAAAAATALGTLPILTMRTLSDRLQDTMLGF